MYNDVDMVWLADPFPYLEGEHDVYFMDDMAYVSLLIALSFKFANVNNNTLLVLSKPLRTGFSNIFSARLFGYISNYESNIFTFLISHPFVSGLLIVKSKS